MPEWIIYYCVSETLFQLCFPHFGFQKLVTSYSTKEDFPGGSMVKNPPATQQTQLLLLGQEDPLEKEMATHPSILAWEIQ